TRHGYEDVFLANFASMTPENEMKMEALQPRRGEFDFKTADAMVAWAVANGKQVHGHTLVFKSQNPGWLTEATGLDKVTGKGAPYDRDELLAIMRDHVTRVMQHFAGSVRRWDVVNEALRPDGSYMPSVWHDTIGPEYVVEAYRAARAAVPDATLCYNEIGAEVPGPLADATYELVAKLKAEGLIDCVGFQMHVNGATPPARDAVQENLERFAGLGVELHVSEMDVDVSALDPAARFDGQARIFGEVAAACHAVAACTRFTTWGVTDAATWLGPDAQPLPFDASLAPKPAWAAIQRGLSL
ncbi:MAG TPA: endo-1,4-beta-xylanase, partial [Solirubrobacteraceae bacterium]